MIVTREVNVRSKGEFDVQDITAEVAQSIKDSGLAAGIVTIFCPGSTGGITTMEFESGVISDFETVLDEITPPDQPYVHHMRWGDRNGHSHIRAALIGPSLTVPFMNGTLTLGTWQQIVFCDFDTEPRSRRLVVQIMGEK